MFPLFFGGFYRVMPSDCFAWELGFGYAMELFVGLIPSLFFMVSTNAEADESLIAIASGAIIIKLLSLLIFIAELSVMVCEIYKVRTLQKLEIGGFKKLTEEERREKHSARAFAAGILTVIVIALVVIIGFAAIPSRACDDLGYPANLEMATCQECLSESCIDCSGGSKKCN